MLLGMGRMQLQRENVKQLWPSCGRAVWCHTRQNCIICSITVKKLNVRLRQQCYKADSADDNGGDNVAEDSTPIELVITVESM